MEFELSNVCNLACVMCDGRYSSIIRSEREKLPPVHNPYSPGFVKELEEFIPHLSKAKFQGGEPFLISIYYEIWEEIIRLNPKCVISVQTNGTVLNKRIESFLSRGNFHITVSVDAVSRVVFESIRIRGDFQNVMDNISSFRSYCKRKNSYFGVATCPMQQNWHEIPDIINYCNNMDAPVTFNRVWHPPNCALWNTGSEKLDEIHKFYSQINLPEANSTQLHNKQQFNELIRQIEIWAEKRKTRDANISEFEKLDNEELKNTLLKKIIQHSDIEFSGGGNQTDNELLMMKIDKVLSHFTHDKSYRIMLEKLYEIPLEVLVNEFRKNPEEILVIQAKNYLQEL
jgi:MoaA/NifB/PqqE/SkfB family radical SAM enzyme